VPKDSIFACILDAQGKKILEQRYGTLTHDLTGLCDTLAAYGCGRVAMESTSIYWQPVWRVLQPDFSLMLANPYFIKQLPPVGARLRLAPSILTGSTCRDNCEKVEPCRNKGNKTLFSPNLNNKTTSVKQ
jgi:hypothetical protein